MDRNTLENSIVQLVEQEYQDEQNSSQEWVLSQHSAHQQTLQFLKRLDLLTNGMGLVSEMYHFIYSLIPHARARARAHADTRVRARAHTHTRTRTTHARTRTHTHRDNKKPACQCSKIL